jgi:predicted nuclease with TOPRIM domain
MKASINHLHLICKDWLRELNFYKSEIPIFRTRLEEIASDYSSKEILARVDHFENKFYIMSNHFDELLHDVNLKEQYLANKATEQPKYISVKMIEMDQKLEDLMVFTATDFSETKKEFYQFLSKYM